MDDAPLIQTRELTKHFPAVRALHHVSLDITAGEVRGVVGENGAGKSTLMKILSGVYQPTSGKVLLRGQPARLHTVHEAAAAGIAMIHQELNLVDELSVAENIFLGREQTRLGLIDRGAQRAAARDLLHRVGSAIEPDRKVSTLSIAQQQLVEIAKALAVGARILIMDEPTAVLTQREMASLFELIRQLKRDGVTVLYISHHLREVIDVSDRITVLRDGEVVATLDAAEATESKLANLMVGRPITDFFPPRSAPGDEEVLRVRDLHVPGCVREASFSLRRGEILGFAGLIGAGRTELGEAIAGLRPLRRGEIVLDGVRRTLKSPVNAVRAGIAYLSEDRKGRGLVTAMGLVENTTLVSLRRYCRPLIDRRSEEAAARRHVETLGTRCGPLRAPVATLSGGNQQKVALAKWLEVEPRVLILDEPTRGIDIAAKREIYDLIKRLAESGRACIFISSELPELLGMCHRIAVMRAGRIEAILDAEGATEQQIMHIAAGVVAV